MREVSSSQSQLDRDLERSLKLKISRHEYREIMLMNVKDVVTLLDYAIDRVKEGQDDERIAHLGNEAVKCFQVCPGPCTVDLGVVLTRFSRGSFSPNEHLPGQLPD